MRDKDELEIFGHLTSAKNRFVKKITAYGGILVICAIAISNLSKGDGVDFRFGGVGVIIPEIYLVFVGASAFAGTIYLLLQVIVFLNVQAHYEHHIKPGNRFIGAELSLIGDENSDITGPIRVGHFFRLNNKFCTFSMITYLAPIFAAFLPFLASVTLLFEEALCGVLGSSDVFAGRLLSFVSLLLLILPTIYSVIFFVPVGTYKDKETINASFLARVTRR